jgi:hypothetical protein
VSNDLRPLHHMHAAGKLYPNAWKMVEDMLAGRGGALPAWPRRCFLPMAGWYAIISQHAGVESDGIGDSREKLTFGAVWRGRGSTHRSWFPGIFVWMQDGMDWERPLE